MIDELKPGAIRLSREQLYDLVWEEPMTRLAARFGLSDVALAKRCRKMHVPVPPRGYWRRLSTGQKPMKTRLLEAPAGTPEMIRLTVVVLAIAKAKRRKKTASQHREKDGTKSSSADSGTEETPLLPLPDKVAHLHPLVSATKAALLDSLKKPTTSGFAYACGKETMNVRGLGPASIDRAMRILHVIVTELERRGHGILTEREKSVVKIGAERVEFRLEEKHETRHHKPTAQELARQRREPWYRVPRFDSWPTDKLVFRIEEYVKAPRKKWSEGVCQCLDTMLMDVVIGIEAVGEALRLQTEERERQHREREEQCRRNLIPDRRQREEEERFEALAKDASAWDLGRCIDAYADAVEQNAKNRGRAEDPDVRRWLDWARHHAADLDPTRKELPTRKAEWDEPPDFG